MAGGPGERKVSAPHQVLGDFDEFRRMKGDKIDDSPAPSSDHLDDISRENFLKKKFQNIAKKKKKIITL